jgi:hypothetical protein
MSRQPRERREKRGLNPWTIIGWLFVLVIVAIALIVGGGLVSIWWLTDEAIRLGNEGAGR